MLEIKNKEMKNEPDILIMGIGGGGNNAVERMLSSVSHPVTYAIVNTDVQVLNKNTTPLKLQIGEKITSGYGAGGDPAVGAASAEESEEKIAELIHGRDLVILTCGLGGGTGTGAITPIAKQCKAEKILTIAVVTMPFVFEGIPHNKIAQAGLEALIENVDTLLVIQNQKLLEIGGKSFYLEDAFLMADSVLSCTITALTNIIFNTGMVNLDFNDLKSTLSNKGMAFLGIGKTDKNGMVLDAVKGAIESPLLDIDISKADTVLINTSGQIDLMMLNDALNYVKDLVDEEADILWGTVPLSEESDQIVVTVIVTGIKEGLSAKKKEETAVVPEKSVRRETFTRVGDEIIQIPSFLQKKR